MIDIDPDLFEGPGITTDTKTLATLGSPVRGISADGVTIVLLRMKANFAGERLQITVVDDAGKPSTSSSENGALAEIRTLHGTRNNRSCIRTFL